MLTINVEITPGEDITSAFADAIELAKKLNCWVNFKFNGVECATGPNGNADFGAENYLKALSRDIKFKYAHA